MSVEGYYQLKWEGSNIDECGTYFSGANTTMTNKAGNCTFGFPFYRDNASAFNYGKLAAPALVSAVNPYDPIGLNFKDGPTPKDGGQWGLAFRAPIDAIDTEVGLYAMNIHSRIPVLTFSQGGNLRGVLAPGVTAVVTAQAQAAVTKAVNAAVTAGQLPAANAAAAIAAQMASPAVKTQVATGVTGLLGQLPQTGFSGVGNFLGSLGLGMLAPAAESVGKIAGRWEYPEDMKVFGVTATTTLAGWSMGAELSYTKDLPIQRNGNDSVVSSVLGLGPASAEYKAAMGVGAAQGIDVASWDKTHKTQLQINAVNTLPGMLGAISGLLVGEVAAQVSGVQNGNGSNVRYGRAFIFGNAAHNAYSAVVGPAGLSCVDPASMTSANTPGTGVSGFFTNPNPTGCANDGYMTHSAWGYRIKASLDYSQIFGTSWNATPSIFWAHDVKGYAVDYQFTEGRKVVSLGLNFSLNKEHNVMLNYTTYANSAKYDAMRDKDNASVAYSYTF